MTQAQRAVGFESKHVKCDVDEVQAVIKQHEIFFWEPFGTNTVVSKDSHLEQGGVFDRDTIYSVTVTERFSTVDFKRTKDIPNYQELRAVEAKYFPLVSQLERLGSSSLDNYATPPPKQFNWIAFLILCVIYVLPGVLYWYFKSEKYKKICAEWQALKTSLDELVSQNNQILNV